ncbi:hypothetical protein NDU88_003848 [Pleurodeles waltl]|uniref:Uncharacterized protein n=1 Tax=Pleurodeles waltl TaxID=8319 RepID=A0AAV7UZM5_PLEWA|nr:hypothetical protein NDU88_003848 [Pleurodeles waltl]
MRGWFLFIHTGEKTYSTGGRVPAFLSVEAPLLPGNNRSSGGCEVDGITSGSPRMVYPARNPSTQVCIRIGVNFSSDDEARASLPVKSTCFFLNKEKCASLSIRIHGLPVQKRSVCCSRNGGGMCCSREEEEACAAQARRKRCVLLRRGGRGVCCSREEEEACAAHARRRRVLLTRGGGVCCSREEAACAAHARRRRVLLTRGGGVCC